MIILTWSVRVTIGSNQLLYTPTRKTQSSTDGEVRVAGGLFAAILEPLNILGAGVQEYCKYVVRVYNGTSDLSGLLRCCADFSRVIY